MLAGQHGYSTASLTHIEPNCFEKDDIPPAENVDEESKEEMLKSPFVAPPLDNGLYKVPSIEDPNSLPHEELPYIHGKMEHPLEQFWNGSIREHPAYEGGSVPECSPFYTTEACNVTYATHERKPHDDTPDAIINPQQNGWKSSPGAYSITTQGTPAHSASPCPLNTPQCEGALSLGSVKKSKTDVTASKDICCPTIETEGFGIAGKRSKKERNKDSARECRKRKKGYITNLETEVKKSINCVGKEFEGRIKDMQREASSLL